MAGLGIESYEGGAKACIAEIRCHWPVEARSLLKWNERGAALRLGG